MAGQGWEWRGAFRHPSQPLCPRSDRTGDDLFPVVRRRQVALTPKKQVSCGHMPERARAPNVKVDPAPSRPSAPGGRLLPAHAPLECISNISAAFIPRLLRGGIFGTYPPSTTCLRGRKRCSRAPPVAAEPPVRPPPGGRAFRCRNPAKSARSAVVEPREAASHEKVAKEC